MQAFTHQGNRLARGDRAEPAPGRHEVRVRVSAVALNNADLQATDGDIAGWEFSGVVDATGDEAPDGLLGQRVMGTAPHALAEAVIAHASHVLPVPDGITDEDAAALPTGLLTEYGAARAADVTEGSSVLLTAATSGIALLGVQVVRELGATLVIGTTRSEERAAGLESAGVDVVVVTDGADLAEQVRAATDGRGTDAVLDHVGGPLLAPAIAAARHGGSVVSVGRLAGAQAQIDLTALAARSAVVKSVSYGFDPPAVIGDLLIGVAADLDDALRHGRVRAVIDSVHDDPNEAMTQFRSSETFGKVVVRFPKQPPNTKE